LSPIGRDMNKRQRIKTKTGGLCAYCGKALVEPGWHIDHVDATWRGRADKGGNEDESNLLPACARCNRWKKVLSPDAFRNEIDAQFERLYRDSAGFRLAVDYGVIERSGRSARFYVEAPLVSANTDEQ